MDMSLDDMIESTKKEKRPGRGGSRRGGKAEGRGGSQRRQRQNIERVPYSRPPPLSADEPWQHDMFEATDAGENPAVRRRSSKPPVSGARIEISNLDWAVSNNDVQELFGTVGEVTKAEVDYDRSGRSLGTGQVLYPRVADAKRALAKFNGVELDGKPMHLKLVLGSGGVASRTSTGGGVLSRLGVANAVREAVASNSQRVVVSNNKREPTVTVRLGGKGLGEGTTSTAKRGRGGRGGRGGRKQTKTAAELDQELSNLYSDKM